MRPIGELAMSHYLSNSSVFAAIGDDGRIGIGIIGIRRQPRS
jgi:hypothetical protein